MWDNAVMEGSEHGANQGTMDAILKSATGNQQKLS